MADKSNSPGRKWRRTIPRLLVLAMIVLAVWVAAQVRWIRDRHHLIARQASLIEAAREGRFGEIVNQGRTTRGEEWSAAGAILRLFGEPPRRELHLILFVDDPEDPYGETERARRLFPEAEGVTWQGYRREAKQE